MSSRPAITKNFSFSEQNLKVQITRELFISESGPYRNDSIVIEHAGKKREFRDFATFFAYVDRKVSRDLREKLYRKLDETNLCVRCGYCCTTGAPPLTLEDARRIIKLRDIVAKLEQVFQSTQASIPRVSDEDTLFLLWNALLDFLKPCPLLRVQDVYTSCIMYSSRPTFCAQFKCWSPYTDERRRQLVDRVLSEIDEVERRRPELSQLAELARTRLLSIQATLVSFT